MFTKGRVGQASLPKPVKDPKKTRMSPVVVSEVEQAKKTSKDNHDLLAM